jgi:5'-methylthioadenosine phosphorylase
MADRILGVIGGSGLYDLPDLEDVERIEVETPFGDPSDAFVRGRIGENVLVFLPRHGVGHRLLPTEINHRANIWGLKHLGCTRVLSVSAVGSMQERIAPGDVVVVDQFFDRTKDRIPTFFGDGLVAHVMFADPVCAELAGALGAAAEATEGGVHRGGTYVCIEGPAFSTRAESRIFRQWGVDVIGMTNLPEARLAREAELCYATLALATDYDCWHESEEDVSVEAVLAVLRKNVARAQAIVRGLAAKLSPRRGCGCGEALAHALITDPDRVPVETRERLDLIAGRYLRPPVRAAGAE